MKNSKTWLLIIIVAELLLNSCASQIPEATLSATVVIKPSDTPAPTLTNTPEQTKTISPSDTPELVPERRVTPTPETWIIHDVLSTDRRWRAIVIRTTINGEERSIFKVQNDNDRIEWIVDDVPFEDVHVSGFPFPEPFYWSKNGQYLYFTYQRSGDGCFAGGTNKGEGFYRFDLATGLTMELSPNFASWMSISPDEKTLAYFIYAKQGITLRDLESGKERTFDQIVQQEDIGMELDQRYIVWAPDSQSLVYVIMAGVCDFKPESYFNWLVYVDLKTGTQRVVFEKDNRGFVPVSWPETDKILIRDGSGQLLWLNPTTDDIDPVQ